MGFVKNTTMCSIVKMMGDIIVPVLAESILSADYLCSYAFKVCEKPKFIELPSSDFVNRLLDSKPESLKANDYLNKIYKKLNKRSNEGKKIIRAVQMADPHIDFDYE